MKYIPRFATLVISLLTTLGSNAAQPVSGVTFTKITTGSLVTDIGESWAAAWGDYDGDGFLDLFVTHGGFSSNLLYHNNGMGPLRA